MADIDVANNRVKVGFREELFSEFCTVREVNWLASRQNLSGVIQSEAWSEVQVKLRYRQQAVPARVRLVGEGRAEIQLATPQFAVAPGQGAVFYDGPSVLGGGIIDGRRC